MTFHSRVVQAKVCQRTTIFYSVGVQQKTKFFSVCFLNAVYSASQIFIYMGIEKGGGGEQSLISIILIFLEEAIINVIVRLENLKAMTCNFSHRSLCPLPMRCVVLLA